MVHVVYSEVCRVPKQQANHMCQGLNSHYFHIIRDGHQPNSRGLYTHYKSLVARQCNLRMDEVVRDGI